MKINTNFLLRVSMMCIMFSASPIQAQLDKTFSRIWRTILQDDVSSVGPFPGGFDLAADEAELVLTPALNSLIATNVASFPLTSTVPVLLWQLSKTGVKEITESLGPIFSETGETIGSGNLYIGLNHSYYSLTKFRGLTTEDFRFTFTYDDVNKSGTLGDSPVENETIDLYPDLNINAQTLVLYSTYGLTKNFDIGVAVPIVDLSLSGQAVATLNSFTFAHYGFAYNFFNDNELNPVLADTFRYSENVIGLGDIALRLKYSFRQHTTLGLAAFVEIRVPTGDKQNFLGTGNPSVRFSWIMSKKMQHFTPHLNIGYDRRWADFDSDELEFVIGFDGKIGKWTTFVLDLIGEYDLQGEEVIKLGPSTRTLITTLDEAGPARIERTLDLNNIPTRRDHILNLSTGVKFAAFEKFSFLANILIPMNDGGLRSTVASTFGLSFTF